MVTSSVYRCTLLIGIALAFAVLIGLGVKKRSHVYYTIGAAGLGLAALELVYPGAFSTAAIAADLALIPVAVWAVVRYDRGRLDRYSQGLVAIVVAIILLTGVSMSLAPPRPL